MDRELLDTLTVSSTSARAQHPSDWEWVEPSSLRESYVGELSQSANSPMRRERLDDPSRVRSVFRALAASRCRGFVRASEGQPLQFAILHYDEEAGELVCDFDAPIDSHAPCVLEVEGYASMYWIPVAETRGPQDAVRCRVPLTLVRAGYRQGTRGVAAGLEVRYRHPQSNRLVRSLIRDVSKRGLSFWLDSAEEPDLVGTWIESLEILCDGESVLSCSAKVRSITQDTCGAVCGLHLHVAMSELSAWTTLVDPVLHPNTVAYATDTDELWRLYEESGYMRLSGRSDSDFRDLQETFMASSARLASAPQIGCQVVFPAKDSGQLQATASMLKTHTHTWLGYQMAKLPGRVIDGVTRREMLRHTLMHAYEHARWDPQLRWLVVYVQEGTRFSEMAIKDFSARYASEGQSAVVRFRAMQTMTAVIDRRESSSAIHVEPGADADGRLLYDYAVQKFPAAYVDALDLEPNAFHFSNLIEEYSSAGLQRDRALLVARDENKVLAVAVLELASKGLHLFGLLDCARFYPVSPDAHLAYDELVAATREWYRVRGRKKFVLFREGDDTSLLEGFEDLGFANQTITSAALLGDLLEHLFEVTAPSLLPGALD